MPKRKDLLVEHQFEEIRTEKPIGVVSGYYTGGAPEQHVVTTITYKCSLCKRHYKEPPTDRCPGVMIYQWEPWPEGMLTRRQLAEKKLIPGPLAGVIRYDKSADGDGWLRLYRESEATPKPPLSEKRVAALLKAAEKAEEARRCLTCGQYLHDRAELSRRQCYACHDEERADYDSWQAARDAYNLICNGDFVVWDSETTDLAGHFVDIAVVDMHGKVLLNTPVRPPVLVAPGAYNVHHIKDEMLANAPSFREIYPALRQALHGKHWVIYNAGFDTGVLDRETWQSNYRHWYMDHPIKSVGETCAMLLYAQYYGEPFRGEYKWQTLESAVRRFGIRAPGAAHRALGDCYRALDVLYAMAEQYRKESLV